MRLVTCGILLEAFVQTSATVGESLRPLQSHVPAWSGTSTCYWKQ